MIRQSAPLQAAMVAYSCAGVSRWPMVRRSPPARSADRRSVEGDAQLLASPSCDLSSPGGERRTTPSTGHGQNADLGMPEPWPPASGAYLWLPRLALGRL